MIPSWVMSPNDSLPDDVETLKSMLVAERAARIAAEGEAQHRALLIEKLQYTIRKMRHERFGQSSGTRHVAGSARASAGRSRGGCRPSGGGGQHAPISIANFANFSEPSYY